MQVDFEKLTTDWIAFSDIVTPEENETYLIQNRGPDVIVAYESDSEPQTTEVDGNLILPYCAIRYSLENELYLRAYSNVGSINISTTTKGGGSDPAVIESLSITPSTSAQTIRAPSGVDGYSPISVSAVTSSIDANIQASNIKSGVSILGVSGSVTALNGETVTITPSISQQTITPTSPANGITSATVNAVTSSIDANIQAENIKDGVSILGVTGTLNPGGDVITATNKTSYAVTSGEKVWINGSDLVDFYEQGYFYNFDVVGSPTINNETEVVSGFSTSNYIQTETPFNPGNNSYEIKFKISLGSTVSNSDIFGSDSGNYGLWFGIYNSKIYCSGGNGSTSSWVVDGGTYTVSANKTYYVKFTFTGTQYVLAVSEDDVTYINSYSLTSSTKIVFPSPNITKVGCSTRTNFGFSGGSVDLSESYIKINGSDWWVPQFTKSDKIILNKDLTIVGSPTITSNFVVGGFSSQDYLTCSSGPIVGFDKSHSTWYFKFRPTSNVSYACSIFEGAISLQHSSSNRLLSWNGNTSSTITISSSISKDTDYWVKVVIDGSNRTYYISTDGQNYTQAYSASDFGDQSGDGVNFSRIGYAPWTSTFQGTVDLKGVYVQNSDNLTVWSATTKTIPWYINENTLTGIAKENIAVNATGDVETILPEV